MRKGQKSVRGGVEDFLCPFTDVVITQGANGSLSHRGTMAVDIRGKNKGYRYGYYAPCTVKCIKTYSQSGQVMWQSVNKVRCSNGYVGYVTFMTAHDDTMDARVGQIVSQGSKLGNMGTKGYATGVHCHIQCSQSKDTKWYKNKYGVYQFNKEVDVDDVFFMDNTNIIDGNGARWKYLKDVKVETKTDTKYVNLPPLISKWNVYPLDKSPVKKNAIGTLNPRKFGGLSYRIYKYRDNNTTVEIKTANYGRVKIYIKYTVAKIKDKPSYKYGEY